MILEFCEVHILSCWKGWPGISQFLLLQTMKNKIYKKLVIDRSKATKVGTLKIFLYWKFRLSNQRWICEWFTVKAIGRGRKYCKQKHGTNFSIVWELESKSWCCWCINIWRPACSRASRVHYIFSSFKTLGVCHTIYSSCPWACSCFFITSYCGCPVSIAEAAKWICPETWPRKENTVHTSSERHYDWVLQSPGSKSH